MSLFFIWLAVTCLIFFGFCLRVWIKNRHKARFQAKLTILFLAFILIPAIPLVFLSASLLTQSAELLLLPGVGNALETSLETIRSQLERRAEHFLTVNPDPESWDESLFDRESIAIGGQLAWENGTPRRILTVRTHDCPLPGDWLPPRSLLVSGMSRSRSVQLQVSGETHMLTLAARQSENRLLFLGITLSPELIQAKDQISQAITVYNTMSLLKESIIQKNLVWALGILFLIGLGMTAIAAAGRLSKGISEPVRDLVGGMQQAAEGDLTVQIQSNAVGEFGFLVESFNRMIRDLKSSSDKLIEAGRISARQEVARRISHEIKNSLTPISIALRNLRKAQMQDGEELAHLKHVDTLEEEFQILKNMASEFSEFARMPEPKKTKVHMNELVVSVSKFLEATSEHVKFKTSFSPNLPPVDADRDQMKRLLNNLFQNAIEASPKKAIITVTAESVDEDPPCLELEIRDEGKGMDAETAHRAFEPYFTTRAKGTGLGLAIVHKIVDDHAGKIHIESKPDKGTRVFIRFPVSAPEV